MNYLHQEYNLLSGQVVQVSLDQQANVLLMSDMDYYQYRSGASFHYHGGLAKRSPINISVPHTGHWHLVIDLGGGSGTIRTGVRILN